MFSRNFFPTFIGVVVVFGNTALGAPTFEPVYQFATTGGRSPQGQLHIDAELNIYGTTYTGGIGGAFGNGVVFKIARDGSVTNLVEFTGNSGAKPGRLSRGGMLLGSDGNFYGTTEQGGASDRGVVFRLAPDGTYTVLGEFTGTTSGSARGGQPRGMLYRDAGGTIWGTTISGGSGASGTIWRIPAGGSIETIHDFIQGGATGGGLPTDGLIVTSTGNFFGVTSAGNRFFRLAGGTTYSVLGSFSGSPAGGMLALADSNFYGTTSSGGAHGRGTIYRVTPDGIITTMYDLGGPGSLNESNSRAGLAVDPVGNVYGVTNQGGAANAGTIFRYSPNGTFTNLAAFTISGGAVPGRFPSTRPIFGADGNLYGTAQEGAATNGGIVWRMRFGPTPVTQPATSVTRSATLNGTLKPNGSATTTVFEWGITPTALTNSTPVQTIGSGVAAVPTSATISGLAPNTTHFFRIRGDNAEQFQPQRGEILSFTTPANSPPVANDEALHAPVIGEATIIYTAAAHTIDADGDPRTLSVQNYNGAGAAQSDGATITYTNAGFVGTETITVRASDPLDASDDGIITLTNAAPAAVDDRRFYDGEPLTVEVTANDSDADLDELRVTTTSAPIHGSVEIVDAANIRYTPNSSFLGRDSFTYTISDRRGGTASATVTIFTTAPEVLLSEGMPVPGAGEIETGIPEGSVWKRFGVPSINSAGQIALVGSYAAAGEPTGSGVFAHHPGEGRAPVARKGQLAVAAGTDVAFANFKDPLQNERGDIVFLAGLSGNGVTSANDRALFGAFFEAGSGISDCELLAREGQQPPGVPLGARWKSFTSVALATWDSGNDTEEAVSATNPGQDLTSHRPLLAFTAQMVTGQGTVTGADDTGLWFAYGDETGISRALALREGQMLSVGAAEKKVKSFVALMTVPNAPGQGNGVTRRGVTVRVTFTDKTQALLRFGLQRGDAGTSEVQFDVIAAPGDTISGIDAQVANVGLPSQSTTGGLIACVSGLTGGGNDVAALARRGVDVPIELIARKGGSISSVTNEELMLGNILSAVVNDEGQYAMLCTLSGQGVNLANDSALVGGYDLGGPNSPGVIAREGTRPPGMATGAQWATFPSYVVGDAFGMAFTARMLTGAKRGGVTTANDVGLWAAGSDRVLRLHLREGQGFGDRTIKAFTALSVVNGSPAQRRSFASGGTLLMRVTDTLGAEHLVKILLP